MKKSFFVSVLFGLLLWMPSCKQMHREPSSDTPSVPKEASDAARQAPSSSPMTAAEKEAEYLKKLPVTEVVVIPDEIDALMQKKDMSDEELEKIGLFFMGLPKTRENLNQARQALRKVKNHTDANALYWRGMDELYDPYRRFDDKLHTSAVRHIQAAAKMGHIDALRATLMYPDMGLEDGLEKVDAYYTRQAEQERRPEILYQWAKAIESGPYETAGKKAEQLLREAAELGYQPARHAYASLLMADTSNEVTWKKGLNYMMDAAMSGNADACRDMAYLMVQFKNAPEDVFSKDQRFLLNTFVTQSEKTIDALIFDYAARAGGQDGALRILFEQLAQDGSESVSQGFLTSVSAFIAHSASRDACDHLIQDFDWKRLTDARHLTDKAQGKLSDMILACYRDAMLRGEDYPQDTSLGGPSTPVMIASFYDGSAPLLTKKDETMAFAYLVYGAQHDLWDAQWRLAERYANEGAVQDHDRACFWAQKADRSAFCKTVCKAHAAYVSSCATCKAIHEMARKCK